MADISQEKLAAQDEAMQRTKWERRNRGFLWEKSASPCYTQGK